MPFPDPGLIDRLMFGSVADVKTFATQLNPDDREKLLAALRDRAAAYERDNASEELELVRFVLGVAEAGSNEPPRGARAGADHDARRARFRRHEVLRPGRGDRSVPAVRRAADGGGACAASRGHRVPRGSEAASCRGEPGRGSDHPAPGGGPVLAAGVEVPGRRPRAHRGGSPKSPGASARRPGRRPHQCRDRGRRRAPGAGPASAAFRRRTCWRRSTRGTRPRPSTTAS